MSKVIFIDTDTLKANTSFGGNIDDDKLTQWVYITQDIKIQDKLGTKLYDRLIEGVTNGDLNTDEKYILDKYITNMLIHYSAAEALPFLGFNIANGGIYKHQSEQSENADKTEIEYLVNKHQRLADYYTDRFEDYMCYNGTKYPEWTSNSNEDVRPNKDSGYSGGWVL